MLQEQKPYACATRPALDQLTDQPASFSPLSAHVIRHLSKDMSHLLSQQSYRINKAWKYDINLTLFHSWLDWSTDSFTNSESND